MLCLSTHIRKLGGFSLIALLKIISFPSLFFLEFILGLLSSKKKKTLPSRQPMPPVMLQFLREHTWQYSSRTHSASHLYATVTKYLHKLKGGEVSLGSWFRLSSIGPVALGTSWWGHDVPPVHLLVTRKQRDRQWPGL